MIKDIQEKSKELLKSKYIKNKVKAEYILVAERLNPNTYRELLKNIEGDSTQIEVVREMFSSCINYQEFKKDDESNNPLVGTLFLEQLSLIESKNVFQNNASLVRNIDNILGTIYGEIVLNRCKFQIDDKGAYRKFCDNTYNAFVHLVKDTSALKKIDIEQFNKLLQAIPEIINYDSLKLTKVVELLNPFDVKSKATFDLLYPKDKTVKQDWNNTISHNGGYYQIANYFALNNNFEYLNRAFDSLLVNNKNFLNTTDGYNYERLLYDLVITNKLYSNEGIELKNKISAKQLVKSNFPIEVIMLNNLLNNKSDINSWSIRNLKNSSWMTAKDFQLQLERISYNQLNSLAEHIIIDFLNSKTLKDDEKNYMAALLYKAKAFTNNKKDNLNYELINESLKRSFSFFDKISDEYLLGDINLGQGTQIKSVRRSKIFKYGGLVSLTNGWNPFSEWTAISPFKDKSIFINYVIKEKGLKSFYFDKDEDALNTFLLNYYSVVNFKDKDEKWIDVSPFVEAIEKKYIPKKIDKDALLAFLTCYYFANKQSQLSEKYSKQINHKDFLNKEKIKKDENAYKYYNLSKSLLNYYWSQPFKPFALHDADQTSFIKKTDEFDTGFELLSFYPDEFQKRNALLANIDSLQKNNHDAVSIALMDSLLNNHVFRFSRFGNKFFEILGRLSTNKGDKMAMLLLKDKSDKTKPDCLNFFVSGKAQKGFYYQATTFIPDYVSSSSQLSLYITILKNEVLKRKIRKYDGWSVIDLAEDNWAGFPYEDGENENIFYSSSD